MREHAIDLDFGCEKKYYLCEERTDKIQDNEISAFFSAFKSDFDRIKTSIYPREETFGAAKDFCKTRDSQIATIASLNHYWDHFIPFIVNQVRHVFIYFL